MNMVGPVSQFAGIYRERAPDAALREHVRCVWVNDLTGSQNDWIRVVPDGCVDIVWTGTSLIVAGPDTPVHSRSASARNRGGRSLSSWGGFVVAGRASQPFRAS